MMQIRERAQRPAQTVVTCYSVFDRFFPRRGLFDLTEGMYCGEDTLSFQQAQKNQQNYLLDQLGCAPGDYILDIGCGYGTLLERAQQRGLKAIGITLSPEHVRHGRRTGRDIRRLDYRSLGQTWSQAFDGVVANGSAEHFVQPADAAAGQADAIYRRFFQTAHRLLAPRAGGRLVTTVIHFVRRPNPADLLRNPFSFPRESDAFHYAMLASCFGGWYPVLGQLQQCASGYFELIDEVDGTDDYLRTSEAWLRQFRQALSSGEALEIASGSMPVALRHPVQFATMLYGLLKSESWNWQFRPPQPPTRLLRETWAYVPGRP